MSLTLKKIQDIYTLTNDNAYAIQAELQILENCVSYSTLETVEILAGASRNYKLTVDGDYQILVTADGQPNETATIKHYLKLQTSIIESVLDIICDCECGCECSDGVDELCALSMLRAKIDVCKRLTNPQGAGFFDILYRETKCLINKQIYCAVDSEIILGEAECNNKLIKQLIALDYLGMYFLEHFTAEAAEDIAYVDTKFFTDTIFCCVQALGLDIGNLRNNIDSNMGQFTINSGAYVNLPPSTVGDYEITVDNRATTVLTLAMFTSLATPAYADPEGDAPAAVRIDTLPVDGVLKLSGVDVTAGQIILVADINAGNLTYVSPNQDAIDTDTFNFSISDTGSGLFVS